MKSRLLLIACLISVSVFGQKNSIQFESSVLIVDPSSIVPSLQSVKVEHQLFINDNENFKVNFNVGYGYFLWNFFEVTEGNSGVLGFNLLGGKHHCFETTLGLIAGSDRNSSSTNIWPIGGSSNDGRTGLFIHPIVAIGYRFTPPENDLIYRVGIGTTGIYLGVGVYLENFIFLKWFCWLNYKDTIADQTRGVRKGAGEKKFIVEWWNTLT